MQALALGDRPVFEALVRQEIAPVELETRAQAFDGSCPIAFRKRPKAVFDLRLELVGIHHNALGVQGVAAVARQDERGRLVTTARRLELLAERVNEVADRVRTVRTGAR